MMNLRELGRSVGGAVLERVGRAAGRVQETKPLAADVLEADDAYLVVFDTPGAAASDVQVRYKGGAVLVRVDRFREYHEGFEMRFPGRGMALDGKVPLPPDAMVDPERASATLRENGTLEVYVPKRATDTGQTSDTATDEDESETGTDDVAEVPAEGGEA